MSFGEKIASIMERPGQDPVSKDDVPWWMKYAGRGLGTVGSLIAIFLGAWNCIGIVFGSVMCFISGILQMIAGFLVVTIEAPCCCMFIDFVQNLSDWVEKRPYWNRAAGYCIIALPSIFLCPSLSSIFGCGLIFTTGIIYGLMSLGKKAPIDEMRTAAVNPQIPSSSMKSNLVENAEPMGFTSKSDSNV
ncbi:calcium channel flower isoform X1 [Microplitis mediator]|uniref:calcium channel flower isoform X1 n=1 Tax=Microplitis mediator TaxID=375433 RepID=UPI0025562122|nr:calcium channel flower isoform X1 [Microplitis mediator]